MHKSFVFFAEVTPVAKARHRVGRTKWGFKMYSDPKTKKAENELAMIVKRNFQSEPYGCPIEVKLTFVLPKPKRPKYDVPAVKPDIDNFEKQVFDSLNGVLWEDDALICKVSTEKMYVRAEGLMSKPGILIEVVPL